MAVYFMLAAECGTDMYAALTFTEYFQTAEFTLSDETAVPLSFSVARATDGNWWAEIYPKGASYGSYTSEGRLLSNYRLLDNFKGEMENLFYRLLQKIECFRYAKVGCDIEQFVLYNELSAEIK